MRFFIFESIHITVQLIEQRNRFWSRSISRLKKPVLVTVVTWHYRKV